MENPIKMDDLGGPPLFLETPTYKVIVFVLKKTWYTPMVLSTLGSCTFLIMVLMRLLLAMASLPQELSVYFVGPGSQKDHEEEQVHNSTACSAAFWHVA